jgi:hypothetical protein
MPFSLAWLVADPSRQKLMVPYRPWYRTGRGTAQTVLFGTVRSHVLAWPAARESLSYKWGAAGWG